MQYKSDAILKIQVLVLCPKARFLCTIGTSYARGGLRKHVIVQTGTLLAN